MYDFGSFQVMKKMGVAQARATGQEWATKQSVQTWETLFAKELIRTLIQPEDLEREMNKLKKLFKQDTDGAANAILLVLEEAGQDEIAKTLWQPQFWHARRIMNIDSLNVYFQNKGQKLKDLCPYLFRIQVIF